MTVSNVCVCVCQVEFGTALVGAHAVAAGTLGVFWQSLYACSSRHSTRISGAPKSSTPTPSPRTLNPPPGAPRWGSRRSSR